MEQESKLQKISMSLPFWWIILTIIYLALSVLTVFGGIFGIGRAGDVTGYLAALVGLFVPMGFWNFITQGNGGVFGLFAIPLILLTVFGGEWFLRKLQLSRIIKFLMIIAILFILTIVVDFAILGKWQSWELVKYGGIVR